MNIWIKRKERTFEGQVQISCIVLGLLCLLYCGLRQGYDYIRLGDTSGMESTVCSTVSFRVDESEELHEHFTVFEDTEGNTYELRTTFADKEGRGCELYLTEKGAFRKEFEAIRPFGTEWAFYIAAPVLLTGALVIAVKKRL